MAFVGGQQAIGGSQWAIGCRQVAVAIGWWATAVDDGWLLPTGGGWQSVGGRWQLSVGGRWRLKSPLLKFRKYLLKILGFLKLFHIIIQTKNFRLKQLKSFQKIHYPIKMLHPNALSNYHYLVRNENAQNHYKLKCLYICGCKLLKEGLKQKESKNLILVFKRYTWYHISYLKTIVII